MINVPENEQKSQNVDRDREGLKYSSLNFHTFYMTQYNTMQFTKIQRKLRSNFV